MKYSDQQRIEKIRETTEKLLNYVQREQITPEKICNEETWIKIAGLRHRLVHHYEDTNWIVVCAIIFDVLPEFLEEIRDL